MVYHWPCHAFRHCGESTNQSGIVFCSVLCSRTRPQTGRVIVKWVQIQLQTCCKFTKNDLYLNSFWCSSESQSFVICNSCCKWLYCALHTHALRIPLQSIAECPTVELLVDHWNNDLSQHQCHCQWWMIQQQIHQSFENIAQKQAVICLSLILLRCSPSLRRSLWRTS